MTVVIKEEVSNEDTTHSLEKSSLVKKVTSESKVEDQFMKFFYSPKFSLDDVITYVLERAVVICKDCLELVYHVFYQIVSGKTEEINGRCILGNSDIDISQEKATYYSYQGMEEVFAEKDYNVLGVTQAEKDAVYKITASMMRMTGRKKICKVQCQDQVDLQPLTDDKSFNVLGTTQEEKDNVYTITAFLMRLPGKKKNCTVQYVPYGIGLH